MSETIRRFDIHEFLAMPHGRSTPQETDAADGEYVLHSDHESRVKELEARILTLEKENEQVQSLLKVVHDGVCGALCISTASVDASWLSIIAKIKALTDRQDKANAEQEKK